MCEACIADCKTLGEVVPGLTLVRATRSFQHFKAGDYGLVQSNGPDVTWTVKPTPDLCEGLTDDEINDLDPKTLLLPWLNDVAQFTKACQEQLSLTTAYDIGVLCAKAGFNREEDGNLEHWLFHRMGCLLAWEKTA